MLFLIPCSPFYFFLLLFFFFSILLPGAFRFPENVGKNYFEAVVDGVDADKQRGVFLLGSLEFFRHITYLI